MKAHLDFMFSRQNKIAVLETKSVSNIPDAPYPSWIEQIHFQMGLVALNNSSLPVMRNGAFHYCDNCVIDAPQLRQ
jgi:hypothetical protein